MLPEPWQTDTCIGSWHYDRGVYERGDYKSAATVLQMLVDIVSKNGNLLLSVPVRSDGTIDEKERKVVEEIGAWMKVNGEAIYGTIPWKVYGEGPSTESANPLKTAGFNEGMAFTDKDIRYTMAKNRSTLFAIVMAAPQGDITLKALTLANGSAPSSIMLVGSDEKLDWKRENGALVIRKPAYKGINGSPLVLKLVWNP
jgi:alpha-L-fucosidase